MNWKIKTLVASLVIGTFAWTATAAEAPTAWTKQCSKCHGKDGAGKTKMGRKLKIMDYTDAAVQAKMTDEEMTKTIKEGKKEGSKTRMKAYGSKLSDDEVKALVAYIRTLKK